MKRLLIKKLIVISDVEKKSREVYFSKGLNVVIGENKTGKSSLIKSIFYAFGCEVFFEDIWKELVQKYIIHFDYGDTSYCIIREKKFIKFFNLHDVLSPEILSETEHFHDYSEALMKEFEINMDCLTSNGVEITLTPPLLFRFQYIDQDLGWSKIGESFTNIKYIKNWKDSIKYVVGYQGEEFYKEKQNLLIVRNIIQEYNVKLKNFNELLKAIQMKSKLNDIYDEDSIISIDELKVLFLELNELERKKIKIAGDTSQFNNDLYEKNLQLKTIKSYIKELDKDHEFALNQEDDIVCPTCGTLHRNTMFDRLEIVKDIQSANEMVKQIRYEIKAIESELLQLRDVKIEISQRYAALKNQVDTSKEAASIANTYRNEGMQAFILTGKIERDQLINLIGKEERTKIQIEKNIKDLNSPKRKKQIVSAFKEIYEKVLSDLNVPLKTLKLKNFVQELTKTGSENPRIIYAYHVSLYLYNLNRQESPFNFLVIDTPNQQGQDGKNLKNIDEVLGYLLDHRGQVIIGTERETGYESQASNVIYLLDVRKTLTEKDYNEHVKLFKTLEEL
ncbi:hypothetical protein ACIOBL_10240 [Paenibacillus taichungensis]|uniref:hypothetical protein n=1 Tax=Paenibacillus taichungensis TaxID=484184 RepID=UPI00381CE886